VGKPKPVVLHPEEPVEPSAMPGLEERQRHDADGRWVGLSGLIRNEAGDASGWHHHAANDTYVYVIRGSIVIEFGADGGERIEARAGDFFVVPADTIHRETTGPDSDLDAFIIRVGTQPEYVQVDGPEQAQ
jgi:uncharacterized RmlC-like cupin family protein